MDIMQVLEDTALDFSNKTDVSFVNFMIDRNFAKSAIDEEFGLTDEAKKLLLKEYLERKY